MNFKSLIAAAALAAVSVSSFAGDIDLSAAVSTPLDSAAVLAFGDAALTAGDVSVNNNAVILQDAVDGSTGDVIAYIDQNAAAGSFALIYQGATATGGTGAIAYINQNATINTRAVITQR